MNQKTIFERLYLAFKEGMSKPTLPENIIAFQKWPIIRIIRVLGGLSLLSIMTRSIDILIGTIFYKISLHVSLFFIFLFILYHFFVS